MYIHIQTRPLKGYSRQMCPSQGARRLSLASLARTRATPLPQPRWWFPPPPAIPRFKTFVVWRSAELVWMA
eukprot:6179658-Pleurochrysis_carterae.AAC.1